MKKLFDNIVFRIITGLIRTVFITVILIYLAFILVQRFTGNGSVFGYRFFTVATGSMAGVYDINDVIAVKDCDPNTLKVGDDIAYRGEKGGLEGLLITHRIINIEESEKGKIYTTRGVNAPAEDPKITANQILGIVVGEVPFISQLNHIIKSQLGFFLLVFCPLVLIIVLEVLQTITDIEIEKKELQLIEHGELPNNKIDVDNNEEKTEEKTEEKKEKELVDEEII